MDPECDSAPVTSELSVECWSCLVHLQEYQEHQPPPIEPCLSEDMDRGDGPPACVASQFEGICDQTTGDCDDMAARALLCGTNNSTLDTSACDADELSAIDQARSDMCGCADVVAICV